MAMKNIKNSLAGLLILGIVSFGIGPFLAPQAQALSVTTYTADATGVTFTMNTGRMRLQVCQEDIIRVQFTTASSLPAKTSLSVNKIWDIPMFNVTDVSGRVTITTSRLKVKVDKSNGSISYTDLDDNVILSEDSANSKTVTPVTVEGVSTNRIETLFNSPADEALFGLGQHQDNVMNRKGTNRHINNVNTEINIPMLVSNRGYGIFWDNYSTSDFYGAESNNTKYRYVSECGEMVDYYFFYGPDMDRVVALYRTATGAAPLFPKWAYGLFQSKDKYGSQSELLSVKNGYRSNNIPVDCIVQDWDYWTPYAWGSHFMDEARYPNPASLITEMHNANVHTMISIWPVYKYVSTLRKPGEQDNYNELNNIGALYPSGGAHHFYDPFNSSARNLVYRQINDDLVGKYGWDGIWADNTEPQAYPDSLNMRAVNTALGKGAFYINAYPLQHAKALYDGWRAIGPDQKRVYVLTRSAFAGQQRYATTCWSGDINCDFATYAKQIPAGLNLAIAGMPYWTTDIGGYWGHPGRVDWTTSASNELFTRWFQYGVFCPIFRIHGGGSRELYGNSWNATTKANLLKFDNLRYRLMPYIYSLAWKVTDEGDSIMRPLVFDYRNDANVFNIKDQFLFGPAFLVNPVITAGATSRSVYLPSGTWYNFWTGSPMSGGSRVSVGAPLSEIPLFVKAGSIVPMGPYIQYATQSIDPLEIRVYKGQNGSFTLYEDQGDTYNYESGQSSQIKFTWNESTQQLTIGARAGSYSGMPLKRTFNIVWVNSNHGNGVNVGVVDQVVNYNGSQVIVNCTSSSPSTIPTLTPIPTPTSGEGPQIGVNYTIVNRNSGKLLDVNNGSTADGGDVVQWTGNGGASQRWKLEDACGGYYYIVNSNSGKTLDVYGLSTADGGNIIQWTKNGGTNQQWRLQDAGSGYYYLVNRNSNKVADVYAVSTADGGDVVQWRSNGGANQQWSFVQ
jgi:alpha-D-xyloside xylohydrolase